MTIQPALQFSDADIVGRVVSVDTSRVAIDVSNSPLLTRIGIGNLLAVKGATEREFLIAVAERVTRSLREELPTPEEDQGEELALETVPADLLRAMLIGTFRTVEATRRTCSSAARIAFRKLIGSATS